MVSEEIVPDVIIKNIVLDRSLNYGMYSVANVWKVVDFILVPG